MLALTSLMNILENVALDLHVVVWTIVLLLSIDLHLVNESVKIVILSSRIVA